MIDFSDDIIAQHKRRPAAHRLRVEVAPDHQVGDRGFGVAELVERLLVKCRIASNRHCRAAVFRLDELATLLFELIELSVLPPERLPPRSELSKRVLDRRFELV
jgi:hypothetical protein